MNLIARERKGFEGIYDVFNNDTSKHTGFTISQRRSGGMVQLVSPQFSTIAIADTVDGILTMYKNETRIKVLDHNDVRIVPPMHNPAIWQ